MIGRNQIDPMPSLTFALVVHDTGSYHDLENRIHYREIENASQRMMDVLNSVQADIYIFPENYFLRAQNPLTIDEIQPLRSWIKQFTQITGSLVVPGTIPVRNGSSYYNFVSAIANGTSSAFENRKKFASDATDRALCQKLDLDFVQGKTPNYFLWRDYLCAVQTANEHHNHPLETPVDLQILLGHCNHRSHINLKQGGLFAMTTSQTHQSASPYAAVVQNNGTQLDLPPEYQQVSGLWVAKFATPMYIPHHPRFQSF